MFDANEVTQSMRIQLSELLDSKKLTDEFIHQVVHKAVEMRAHPFSLSFWPRPYDRDSTLHVIDDIGCTEFSVNAMKLVLRYILGEYSVGNKFAFRLRIIRAAVILPPGNEHKEAHDLYFEVGAPYGNFLCGGCTDYSGEGGSGGRKLEALFSFISAFYEVPLEDIRIPPEMGSRGEADIYAAFKEKGIVHV